MHSWWKALANASRVGPSVLSRSGRRRWSPPRREFACAWRSALACSCTPMSWCRLRLLALKRWRPRALPFTGRSPAGLTESDVLASSSESRASFVSGGGSVRDIGGVASSIVASAAPAGGIVVAMTRQTTMFHCGLATWCTFRGLSWVRRAVKSASGAKTS